MNHDQEHRLETSLSKLLTIGTSIAGLVMVAGVLLLIFTSPGAPRPAYSHFVPTAEQGKGLGTVLASVLHLEPHALMLAGVLLLVLTPFARVVFTLVAFALRRDWLYVALSLVVVTVLAYGLLGGKVH